MIDPRSSDTIGTAMRRAFLVVLFLSSAAGAFGLVRAIDLVPDHPPPVAPIVLRSTSSPAVPTASIAGPTTTVASTVAGNVASTVATTTPRQPPAAADEDPHTDEEDDEEQTDG